MIRNNVNAVIIRDGKILVIEFSDENGVHYNLPGGGVDAGESFEEALVRECFEEAGADVEVGRLLLMWEYLPKPEYTPYGSAHRLGRVFECTLKAGSQPSMPAKPDRNQTAVRWISWEELSTSSIALVPPIAIELTRAITDHTDSVRTIRF